jgi:hypothetical protein
LPQGRAPGKPRQQATDHENAEETLMKKAAARAAAFHHR